MKVEYIFDFLDHSDSFDPVEMVELVSDEFEMSPDEAEGYVCDWIQDPYRGYDPEWHDTADQEGEEDIPADILKDYINSIEVEEDEENNPIVMYIEDDIEYAIAAQYFSNQLSK